MRVLHDALPLVGGGLLTLQRGNPFIAGSYLVLALGHAYASGEPTLNG